MLSSKQLKICKVESEAFAKYCLQRGADYLGVHVIEYALNADKQALCRYIGKRGGRVVLLTKESSVERLRELVDFYKPWGLQLHYPLDAAMYRRVALAVGVPAVPVFTDEMSGSATAELLQEAPLAVYDSSFVGGTGKAHGKRLLAQLPAALLSKVLLAGGIDPEAIDLASPVGGYDVQSYCRVAGRHSYARAEKILRCVKGAPRRQLSVSLTDAHDWQRLPAYAAIQALEYQVDHSEGALYKGFTVDTARLKAMLSTIDAPFTLHIFESTPSRFQAAVDMYMQHTRHNIVRVNIQYSPGLDMDSIDVGDAVVCASVYYKDLDAYSAQYPQVHECLSLILPTDLERKQQSLMEMRDFIRRNHTKEIWFDRRVDLDTVKVVLEADPHANFIAGEYILTDWDRESVLAELLNRG